MNEISLMCPVRWILRKHGADSIFTEAHADAADRLRACGIEAAGIRFDRLTRRVLEIVVLGRRPMIRAAKLLGLRTAVVQAMLVEALDQLAERFGASRQ